MKRWNYLFLLVACLLASVSVFGQDLTIHPTFNNMYGGQNFEEMYSSFETSDGGFMLAGKASFHATNVGNINDPFCGGDDMWLIKTDADGNTVWDSLYGGLGGEALFETIETSDSGFVSIGITNSVASCDVPAGNPFVNDAFVLKVDSVGNVLWTTRLGSTSGDLANTIIETSDGNLLFGGTQQNANNSDDYWIVKLDGTTGAVLWQNTFGGLDNLTMSWLSADVLRIVRETSDGFFLGGISNSDIGGVKTDVHYNTDNSFDFWVVKVDLSGNYVWDFTYGGQADDQLFDMELTPDGGLILGGYSQSDPMLFPNNKSAALLGSEDFWAVKIDASGGIDWDRTYGGNDGDRIYSVEVINVTDCNTNYLFGGITNSDANGDVTNANQGVTDYWIVFADNNGNLIWEKNYGGDNYDALNDFRRNSDGSFILGGHTYSDSPGAPYDTPAPREGGFDNWALKLVCDFDLPDQPDVEICDGETITISASVADCPSCTYRWDANGSFATTKDITVSPSDTTTYTVIVTNATCCIDTTSVTVIFHPNPTVDLGPDTEICPSETITLDATTSGCTYLWSTMATTPSIDATMAGTYSVTITCAFGCTATDELVISPGIIPVVDLGNNTTLCAGDSLLLDAGAGGMDYDWSTGASTQMIYGNDETDYCVTVTSVDGCTTTDCISINFDTVMVSLVPDTMLCPGETLVVSAGNSGCSYAWSNSTSSQSITISSAGTYTVTVTCGVASCTAVDEIVVGYFPVIPPLNLIEEICDGDSLFVEGAWQFISGNYSDTYTSINGCDSVVNTALTVNLNFSQNIPMEICVGDSLFVGGDWQTTDGSYPDTLMTINGCDSIIITDLIVNPVFSQNVPVEICQGDSYLAGGMMQTTAGSYPDTLMTVDGCDSIIITDLIVNPVFSQNVPVEICQGDAYLAGGMMQTTAGSYSDTLMTVDGCDSIIITDLIVNPVFSQNVPIEICQGDAYLAGGMMQTTDGSYPDTLMTIHGCDSIIITDLVVNPTFSQNVPIEICQGDSYLAGGMMQTTDGSYPDTLMTVDGCDSIIITDLIVNSTFSQNVPVEICDGDSIFVGGDWQFVNGSYPDTLMTVNGCDSIIITDLIVNPVFSQNVPVEICQGDSYLAGGMMQTTDGSYPDTLMTVDGCDSIIITDLIVNSVFSQNVPVEICQGDSYLAGGMLQTTDGSYPDTLMTVDGCDSIIITDLIVNPVFSQNVPVEICQGDAYLAGGMMQTTAGSYSDTLMTVDGCDSIIITDLIVNPVFSQNVPVEICQGDAYLAGGMLQTTAGSYPDTLMTVNGCDSIIITDLIVNPVFSQNVPVEICQGDAYLAGGMMQTTAGSYSDTLMTVDGCDSIIITDLIVNPVFSQNVPVEICQGDAYLAGGMLQTTAGSYSDTLMTVDGCDSIIITDLIVNPVFSQNVPVEICQGDAYLAGGMMQTTAGSYSDTLMTVDGCDSIIITDLIVNPVFSQNVPIEICDGDSLFVGGDWQTTDGSYPDTLMTVDGCDSIIITDLIVNPVFSQNVPIEICQGDSYLAGGMLQTTAGSYPDTLMTVDGCDSIIITDLIVNPVFSQNVTVEICQGDSYLAGGMMQTTDGSYPDTLMTVDGCDSIIITDLIVNPVFTQNVPVEICQGDAYLAGGMMQTTAGSYSDTLMTVDGCDSIIITDLIVNPVFSQNVPLEICQGDSLFVGGDWQFVNGSYPDTLMTIGGCDSIIITDLVIGNNYQIMIDTFVCNTAQLGLDSIPLLTQSGCDSLVIYNYQLTNIDSFFFTNYTCDQNLTDTTFTNANGMNGECDSVLVNYTLLAPSFEMNFDTTTCIASEVGLDTTFLTTQFGCDSIIIFDFQLVDADSFFFTNYTCDQNLTDTTFTAAAGMNGECDSILVNYTLLAPSFEMSFDTTTCIASEVGLDTIFLTTQFGCDSIIIFDFQLVDADSFFFTNYTCDQNLTDTTFTAAAGLNGECDSVLVNYTLLAPSFEMNFDTTTCIASEVGLDTTFLTSQFGCDSIIIFDFQLVDADSFFFTNFTCDQNLTDTTFTNANGMNGECDSVLVNYTLLAPSFEMNFDTTTCIASEVGLDTTFLTSQFGCDSIIIFDFQLVDADSFFFTNFTCDQNLTDTTFTNANGMNGECDSVLVNYTLLAPSFEMNFDTTTCIASEVGLDTTFLTSQFGCDSIIIFDFQLVDADSFFFTNFTCDQNLTDTTFTTAAGMNGECDSILVNYTLLAPSFEMNFDTTTCIASEVGLDTTFLTSQFGCDSIIIFDFQLVDADSFFFTNFTCDQNLTDTTFTAAAGMNGECDSILVNYTLLAPSFEMNFDTTTCIASEVGLDTTFLTSQFGCDSIIIFDFQLVDADSFFFTNFTCDQNLTDTTFTAAAGMNGECDSILVNYTLLAPSFEMNFDTTTCIASEVGMDTTFLTSQFGCDSIIIFDFQLVDADSFFFTNFTCDQNLTDTTFTAAAGMNGECDSILVNYTLLAPSFEMNFDTTTCIASEVGMDTTFLTSQFGCDSIIIFDFQLVDADSFFFTNFTCDQNLTDTTFTAAAGMNGECDSVLVNYTLLAPSFEMNFDTTTCIASEVGMDTTFLTSQFGCDSIIIFDFQLVDADSFFFINYTCDQNLTDTTFTNANGMNGECDSVLVNYTLLAPSFEMNFDTTTCIASEVGMDTTFLTSQFGCDSIVIFDFQLIEGDSIFVDEMTCDSSLIGTTTVILPGMNGECDSTLITNTFFACDTFYLTDLSCNPLDTGVFTNINGGNITITTINLSPTDSTYLSNTSCNPLDTGIAITAVLTNQFGCDSIIFTNTTLLPSQNIGIQNTTCDPDLVGVFIDTLQNQNGCDSIVTNTVSLLPTSIDTILTTTCFFDDVGVDTLFEGTNSLGCDSFVLAVTAYVPVLEPFISFSDISCFGEEDGAIVIDSVIGGSGPYLYSINNEAFQSSPFFTNLTIGDYSILIEDANGCQSETLLNLESPDELIVDLGEDIFIKIGESVTVAAEVNVFENEIDTIIWTPSELSGCENNCLDFQITPLSSTNFSILVKDDNGCISKDYITVHVDDRIPVYIPNVFTPNGDNQNDLFTVYGDETLIDIVQTFTVFDRWGEIVYQGKNFHPNDPAHGWDGTLKGNPLNPAVFVYFAEVRFFDGRVLQFEGDVTLVR